MRHLDIDPTSQTSLFQLLYEVEPWALSMLNSPFTYSSN